MTTVRLEATDWALARGDCGLAFSKVREVAGIRVRHRRQRTLIDLDLTHTQLSEFADLIDALVPSSNGHHYLEIAPDQPIQIIVSKGEYPPTLTPARALVADRAG